VVKNHLPPRVLPATPYHPRSMLHLANAELTVDLLDPIADYARLGPRFCGGAFIWQVHDRQIGSLLTGPEWPNPTPSPLNGQGLPESFRHSTTTGEPLLWHEGRGLAPGAGALARDAAGKVVITEPSAWQIDAQPDRIAWRTKQAAAGWSYELERMIEPRGRTLLSHSKLTNRGAGSLKLEWFAHPFFALQADGKLCATLPAGTTLPDNPGYDLTHNELTMRRAFVGANDGCLVHLGWPAGQPFSATMTHPRLTWVRFTTDFAPFKTVLWASGNTLSFEPFMALDLAPGESREWTLTYEFGPVQTGR
jgi:hypothetical protein